MKLKSFGCSLIFGTDLHDDGSGEDFGRVSQFTYPALMARALDYDYECYARAGAGNLQILQKIMDQVIDPSPALYVINWTWIDRFSYIAEHMAHDRNPQGWQTIMPVGEDAVTKSYYRDLHSEFRDKLTSLVFIKTAVDLLNQSGHDFVMTYTDALIFDGKWHITDGMKHLQSYIRPYLTDFAGRNFIDYSRERGHRISASMHPLESAHEDAADLILNNLQHYIKGEKRCLPNVS